MVQKKIDPEIETQIITFLAIQDKDHTWRKASEKFGVSSLTISRILKRNNISHGKAESKAIVDPKYQEALKQFFSLFIELSQVPQLNSSIWNNTIKKHLNFDLMQQIKEELKL